MTDDPRVKAAAAEICCANHECPSMTRGRCYDCQYRARAALAAANKAAWRPISEAPENETWVLATSGVDEDGYDTTDVVRKLGSHWVNRVGYNVGGFTYFMPLPAPPSDD